MRPVEAIKRKNAMNAKLGQDSQVNLDKVKDQGKVGNVPFNKMLKLSVKKHCGGKQGRLLSVSVRVTRALILSIDV